MPRNKLLMLVIGAVVASVAVLTIYQLLLPPATVATSQAESDKKVELRASKTGIDKIDTMNRQESVEKALKNAIEEIRTTSAGARDELTALHEKVMGHVDQWMAALERNAETLSDDAKTQWLETRNDIRETRKTVAKRFEDLRTRSAEEWNEARDATADALENLAAKIKNAAGEANRKSSEG